MVLEFQYSSRHSDHRFLDRLYFKSSIRPAKVVIMIESTSVNASTISPTPSVQADFSSTLYLVGVCAGIFFLFIVLVIIVIAISMGCCRATPVIPVQVPDTDESPSLIQKLDEFKYDELQSHVTQSATQDNLTCPICLSNYQDDDICRRMPSPCMHTFHKKCIDKWFQRSNDCPLCKRSISKLLDTENHSLV